MRAFIERHFGKLWLAVIALIFVFLTYQDEWSPRAQECHAKGGKLMYGGCHRLVRLD